MGRKKQSKELEVHLYGRPVGSLIQDASGNLAFKYLDKWAEHPNAIPISLSLPLQSEPFGRVETTAFFAGILPDNEDIRSVLAKEFEVSSRNPFGLLTKIGRDCAGALQIVPQGTPFEDKNEQNIDWKSKKEIGSILSSLPRRPLGVGPEGEFRISLAGAQHKTAVVIQNGKVGLPRGDTPTTHIIKPPMANLDGIVENEAFCMMLAWKISLDTARAEVKDFDGRKAIVIERYDREILDDGTIGRIHQEDFCQALAVHPDNKYESDGGPGAVECMKLLERTNDVYGNQIAFIDALAFNFLIGGTDAHAKNFSLLLESDGTIRLAPLYDIASGLVYPEFAESDRMAMKIGGKKKFNDVMPRHWERFAKDARFDPEMVQFRIETIIEALPNAAQIVKDECGIDHEIIQKIIDLINERCELNSP